MMATWLRRTRTAFVSALGVTILLGTPLLAQAEQGKWWKPKERERRVERQDRGGHGDRDRGDRGAWRGRGNSDRGSSGRVYGDRSGTTRDRRPSDRSGIWRDRGSRDRVIVRDRRVGDSRVRGGITYRDRRYSGRVAWGGGSSWRGVPIRRDVLTIRDHRYGGAYFRARRMYYAPRYWGRFVYVRPVRYFIAADACIGGLNIRARIVRPHYLYGCNFCDARFDTYGAYYSHVGHCGHRPSGFELSISNWDDGYDSQWDGPYRAGDDYDYDDGYQDDYDDDTYYDN
ncbi:MAG TPA: hypothetical protein VGJ98_05085 [Candidatus Eisenbacteria bacterium]